MREYPGLEQLIGGEGGGGEGGEGEGDSTTPTRKVCTQHVQCVCVHVHIPCSCGVPPETAHFS